MRKYFVEHFIDQEIGTHYFFDTLQEAIDELEEARGEAEGELEGRRRRGRRIECAPYGYGLVIDVPDSECEEGVTDDELIRRIDIPKYTNIECEEHKILSAHNYEL